MPYVFVILCIRSEYSILKLHAFLEIILAYRKNSDSYSLSIV